MPDWEVQLNTKDGQVKTVRVYDYNYSTDAERAALSQTGGHSVNWSSPFRETVVTNNSIEDADTSHFSFNLSDVDFDYSTKSGLIHGYVCAAILPTIILWFFNPFASILFNIAFARWWFTD